MNNEHMSCRMFSTPFIYVLCFMDKATASRVVHRHLRALKIKLNNHRI